VDEAEVERYAVHLGMDPREDTELFWIAEQALLAPLPPQWVEVLMEGDATAFQNKLTGVVTWCVLCHVWSPLCRDEDSVSFSLCRAERRGARPGDGSPNGRNDPLPITLTSAPLVFNTVAKALYQLGKTPS